MVKEATENKVPSLLLVLLRVKCMCPPIIYLGHHGSQTHEHIGLNLSMALHKPCPHCCLPQCIIILDARLSVIFGLAQETVVSKGFDPIELRSELRESA
eukprot:5073267-Amphidinium_carterae.1